MRHVHGWAAGELLGPDAPLPLDRPFTVAEADRHGVSAQLLARLVSSGHLRRVLRGVVVVSQVPDSLRLRVAALKLVVPEHAVVVDRTAAWLHGVDALPRSAIHEMPSLDVFSTAASRMRRGGVRSGIRELHPTDVEVIEGLAVTTMLRTALDLGRLLWRYDALGAIDGFLRGGLSYDHLLAEVERFKGHRGVRQLRELAPLATPLAESNPESALRLRWIEADLPAPRAQVWVHDDDGGARYRIDVGDPDVRYGAEYFGEEFHGTADQPADDLRLRWLDRHRDWVVNVFKKDDLYAPRAEPGAVLRAGWACASARAARRRAVSIDLSR